MANDSHDPNNYDPITAKEKKAALRETFDFHTDLFLKVTAEKYRSSYGGTTWI